MDSDVNDIETQQLIERTMDFSRALDVAYKSLDRIGILFLSNAKYVSVDDLLHWERQLKCMTDAIMVQVRARLYPPSEGRVPEQDKLKPQSPKGRVLKEGQRPSKQDSVIKDLAGREPLCEICNGLGYLQDMNMPQGWADCPKCIGERW
jgi:hypothetical protein